MRLVVAQCTVNYVGRLTAHLPSAKRLLLIKADGSVSVHADDRAYKPLNWMSPPCWLTETEGEGGDDTSESGAPTVWVVENKAGEQLRITIESIEHDSAHELGVDPGLVKDGVEAHLQELLAEHVALLGDGYTLVRREYMTPIGPVDLLCRDADGATVAVEIKRRGEIDGVEQLTRYLELLNRDTTLAPVAGVFAAQQIATGSYACRRPWDPVPHTGLRRYAGNGLGRVPIVLTWFVTESVVNRAERSRRRCRSAVTRWSRVSMVSTITSVASREHAPSRCTAALAAITKSRSGSHTWWCGPPRAIRNVGWKTADTGIRRAGVTARIAVRRADGADGS